MIKKVEEFLECKIWLVLLDRKIVYIFWNVLVDEVMHGFFKENMKCDFEKSWGFKRSMQVWFWE